MAGNTPEEALDAFIDPIRRAVSCLIVGGYVYGSGNGIDQTNALTLWVTGQENPNLARLRTHGGSGEILFRFVHQYTIKHVPDDQQRGPYKVSSLLYHYDVLDRNLREVMVFHWEPAAGAWGPHLHMSAAGSIILPQPHGSPLATERTMLGSLHVPTGRVFIEDLVELLISEFKVVPNSPEWSTVISDHRAAIQRGRLW